MLAVFSAHLEVCLFTYISSVAFPLPILQMTKRRLGEVYHLVAAYSRGLQSPCRAPTVAGWLASPRHPRGRAHVRACWAGARAPLPFPAPSQGWAPLFPTRIHNEVEKKSPS